MVVCYEERPLFEIIVKIKNVLSDPALNIVTTHSLGDLPEKSKYLKIKKKIMKKIIVTIAFGLLICDAQAQYGDVVYPHAGSKLTSGKVTNVNINGFVMAGVYPNAASS